MIPVTLKLPVPVISLLLRSKLPPSCGVVSSTTLERPPPPEAVTLTIPAEGEVTLKFAPKLIN